MESSTKYIAINKEPIHLLGKIDGVGRGLGELVFAGIGPVLEQSSDLLILRDVFQQYKGKQSAIGDVFVVSWLI